MADMVMAEPASWKKGVAELIGTFALIYIGVMVLVANGGGNPLVVVALAHGIILAVLVSATMSISGGQLNPAVTLGLLVARKIDAKQAVVNWVFQIVGGILGGLLAKASLGGASIAGGIPNAAAVTTGQGILIEAIATFLLVSVVFGTGVDARFGGRIGGLAIGLTIAADIMAVGPLTGASMNTARWLGPAIAQGTFPTPAVHILGPLLGAVVAGIVWGYVLLDEPRPHPEPQAQMRAKGNP
jgi:MIP family channel proteins